MQCTHFPFYIIRLKLDETFTLNQSYLLILFSKYFYIFFQQIEISTDLFKKHTLSNPKSGVFFPIRERSENFHFQGWLPSRRRLLLYRILTQCNTRLENDAFMGLEWIIQYKHKLLRNLGLLWTYTRLISFCVPIGLTKLILNGAMAISRNKVYRRKLGDPLEM